MSPRSEGFRRLAWVASACLALVWSWHIYITFVEEYRWSDSDRWVYGVVICLALIVLPHAVRRAAIWVESGFTQPGQGEKLKETKLPSMKLTDEQRAKLNLRLVDQLTEVISEAIVNAASDEKAKSDPMKEGLKQVLRTGSSQYAFALVLLTRFYKRPDFFRAPESAITKSLLIEQISRESAAFATDLAPGADKEFVRQMVRKEVDAVSVSVARFIGLLANKALTAQNNPLSRWFVDTFGIDQVGDQSVEDFTTSMLNIARERSEALNL